MSKEALYVKWLVQGSSLALIIDIAPTRRCTPLKQQSAWEFYHSWSLVGPVHSIIPERIMQEQVTGRLPGNALDNTEHHNNIFISTIAILNSSIFGHPDDDFTVSRICASK